MISTMPRDKRYPRILVNTNGNEIRRFTKRSEDFDFSQVLENLWIIHTCSTYDPNLSHIFQSRHTITSQRGSLNNTKRFFKNSSRALGIITQTKTTCSMMKEMRACNV